MNVEAHGIAPAPLVVWLTVNAREWRQLSRALDAAMLVLSDIEELDGPCVAASASVAARETRFAGIVLTLWARRSTWGIG